MIVAKTQMERFAEDLLRHCFTQDASLVDESGKISRDHLIGKTDSTVTDAPPLIMTITTLTSVRMVGGASLHRFAPRRVSSINRNRVSSNDRRCKFGATSFLDGGF